MRRGILPGAAGVRRRWFAVPIVVLSLVTLAVVPVVTAQTTTTTPKGPEIYEKMKEEASHGNKEAADAVAALESYAKGRGLSIADLPVPDSVKSTLVKHGAIDLEVRDGAPWFIHLKNNTRVENVPMLTAYKTARHDVMHDLAKTPGRQVEVVVTPAKFLTVAEFSKTVVKQPKQIVVDVFTGSHFIMTSGLEVTSFRGWSQLEDDLRAQVNGSLDQFQGVKVGDLRLTVRSARMVMPAGMADSLISDPSVLLVDPLTDLADEYAGKAAVITVGNPPDVFTVHARDDLGVDIYSGQLNPVKLEPAQ